VTGDFNGDGEPDLAVSFGSPDGDQVTLGLQILLGNGDGTFTPMPPVSVVGGIAFVAATADFNGDGNADLVVVNQGGLGGSITILLGNGDGTFAAKSTISLPGGPQQVVVADFNRDGTQDLAVMNGFSNTITVLLGNGDGTFREESNPATGFEPLSEAVGDFNGDGIPDLAVTNQNDGNPNLGSVTVLLGNGDGTFTPTGTSPATGIGPGSIAVADFNGDGKADLAITNSGSHTLFVMLGNGDGKFAAPMTLPMGGQPFSVVIGDFNNDGLPDMAVADFNSSSLAILLAHLTPSSAANAQSATRP
jgi:hypothetical protein